MPLLPLVGSLIVVCRAEISPPSSASRIIATPMRSLTLKPGVNDSSFARTVAPAPSVTRLRRTSGVLPINSVALAAIFGRCWRTRSSGFFTVVAIIGRPPLLAALPTQTATADRESQGPSDHHGSIVGQG